MRSIEALRNDLHHIIQKAIKDGRYLRTLKQYVRSPLYNKVGSNGFCDTYGGCCLLSALTSAGEPYPYVAILGLTESDLYCLECGFEGWPAEAIGEMTLRVADLYMLGREMRRTYT